MAKHIRKKRVVGRIGSSKDYPKLTFEQAIDIVVSGKRVEGVRERTIKDYHKMWGYFTKWLHENYEIEYVNDLEANVFRNYINYMKYDKQKYSGHKYISSENQSIGLSDTTININLRVLKAIINYLYREDYLEVNPIEKVKLIKQDKDNVHSGFTIEEVKEILRQPNQKDYVGFRDYVMMNILLDSGLRINSLIDLKVENIDFQSRFINIPADKAKGRKALLVPISSHVTKLILHLIQENKEHFKTQRLFLSSYGEPLGKNQFNKRLKYYAEKAGIDPRKKRVTAHTYRHTWATEMVKAGVDPYTLQKMGGWSDQSTMQRYIQMDTKQMRKSHDEFSPIHNLNKR
ncbi:tyrosine-type recombinase/integrase [Oceanobacillus sp. CAU 1775]